jgi:ATP synthase protein I
MKEDTREAVRLLAVASTMGLSMVIATVLGLAFGYWMDQVFDTKPWLTMIFLILGIIAGFKNIYVIMRRVQKMSKDKENR